MSRDESIEGALVEFVWEFESSLEEDKAVDTAAWANRWPDATTRSRVVRDLLICACERFDFDFDWLAAQLAAPSCIPLQVDRQKLLRDLYDDLIEVGGSPDWAEFAKFGLAPQDLSLRCREDRFCLGTILGNRYQLQQRLASGGLGTVYRARDCQTDRDVALKVPHSVEGHDESELLGRVRAEAAILERLPIVGIPRFIELLETDQGPVLVLELIRGVALLSLVRNGAIPPNEGLLLVAKVARVADELHKRGFVHGDIKSGNIFINPDGQPVLFDFNISRASDPRMSQDGFPGGTLSYMSPEALVGVAADVDLRQDVFALGALLFQVLTGEELMEADSREEAVVKSVLLGGVHDPLFPDTMPETAQRICRAAISRQPVSRFETAGDFAEACESAIASPDQPLQIPKLRPWLSAWRLGCALGLLMVRQRRVTIVLTDAGDVALDAALPPAIQAAIPYMAGVSTAMDEVRALASPLDVRVPGWAGAQKYLSAFYTLRKLRGRDLENLRVVSSECEKWCGETLQMLESQLTNQELARASLFLSAVQSRFVPYSSAAAERWLECRSALPIPSEITAEFALACQKFDDGLEWAVLIQGLDHHVANYLRWDVQS